MLHRRDMLAALVAAVAAPAPALARTDAPLVEVWKSPTCGCCKDWISHLEANGFKVQVTETDAAAAMRAKLGIAPQYGSCHTARVAGYAVEGHVPAREIRRLLAERPTAVGLAVPAMPIGSPGMDGPAYGGRRDPYDVLLLKKDGGSTVFKSYR